MVVGGRAVAVDERDEIGRVRAAEHCDEREALRSIACEVEGVILERVGVRERESARRSRLPISGSGAPGAGEQENGGHRCDATQQQTRQSLT